MLKSVSTIYNVVLLFCVTTYLLFSNYHFALFNTFEYMYYLFTILYYNFLRWTLLMLIMNLYSTTNYYNLNVKHVFHLCSFLLFTMLCCFKSGLLLLVKFMYLCNNVHHSLRFISSITPFQKVTISGK